MIKRTMAVGFVALACNHSSATPDAGAASTVVPDASARASDDDVKPVYPDVPANPLATKLCDALHATEPRHRRACCNLDGGVAAGEGVAIECARNVSAAMKLGTIDIASADVDACAAGMERVLVGCDWVGPNPPPVASECEGLVHGKLADGAKCRSTLECSGGLACHGVGPTTVGRCGPSHKAGERCGRSSDVLVTYARQDDADARHQPCVDVCLRGRCAARVGAGEACESSEQCTGAGVLCRNGKCAAALAKAGEPCGLAATCEASFACHASGRCGPQQKPAGAACASDLECVGACIKSGSAKTGTCGMRCGS